MKSQEFVDTDLISEKRSDVGTGDAKAPGITSQSRAEIDARVEQARQQMLELRRQQEELERERQELEELRHREEDFEKGKAEMLEELSRTVARIEQEEFEINKRSTALTNFRELYQDYVRQLQDIHESEWSGDELKGQLAKAASVVESAKAELNRGRAQLSFLGEGPVRLENDPMYAESAAVSSGEVAAAFDFKLEFKKGLARFLPLMLFGILALIIILSRGK